MTVWAKVSEKPKYSKWKRYIIYIKWQYALRYLSYSTLVARNEKMTLINLMNLKQLSKDHKCLNERDNLNIGASLKN